MVVQLACDEAVGDEHACAHRSVRVADGDDVPAVFLYNLSQQFIVNPAVTGYTATPTDVEWPGNFASLMTIDKTA